MKIVVLAGGLSPEREVSLSSGSLIANSLIEKGNDVLLLDLFLGRKLESKQRFMDICLNNNSNERYSYNIEEREPNLEKLIEEHKEIDGWIGPNVIKLCKQADITFIALHGAMGENGKLQAVLEAHGIKFTGTGSLGCALAMDKGIAKMIMKANDILTPEWKVIEKNNFDIDTINVPCVVKPSSCGSSVGISIIEEKEKLKVALDYAFKYEDTILIEERIKGREFAVGILNNRALPVIEIVPKNGFYDYKNKYQSGLTDEYCPANIERNMESKMQKIAEKVHKELRLGFYSRMDFIMTDDEKIYCLEANTLPGMTPVSLLPQEAKTNGISFEQLCLEIVDAALKNGNK